MAEGRQRREENGEWTARLVNLIFEKRQTGVDWRSRATVQSVINLTRTSNFQLNLRIISNLNFIYGKDKESQANKELRCSAFWHYRLHIPAYLLYMH